MIMYGMGIVTLVLILYIMYILLEILHQHVPDGDDMADGTGENEEMEHRVHVFLLMEGIEHGTRDITDTLSYEPDDGRRRYGIHQRPEGYEYTQAHTYETECLHVRMFFQTNETNDRTHDGTSPHKHEQRPSPIALRT